MSYRMISLDSSTTHTGYAVWDDGELTNTGLLQYTGSNIDIRFTDMCRAIIHLLDQTKPNIIYIEETVVARNVQVQRYLTRLQGVIYAWALMNGAEFVTIRPTEWRKLVGITGKHKRAELKLLAVSMVENLYNIRPQSDDEAEAILIGQAAINKFN